MKKRTNSVISSMYQPLSSSKAKTALCMLVGGLLLVFLGLCLIATTVAAEVSAGVDETSVLISGPTCLALGLLVMVLSGADMFRHRRMQNRVEAELGSQCVRCAREKERPPLPGVSIVISETLWPS